jgi:hypothetical protein
MPSNKDRVASYLEDDESQALNQFCQEKGLTSSQGVALLIRERLIEPESVEEKKLNHLYNERLERLEKDLNHWQLYCFGTIKSNEKLQEQMIEMGSELDKMQAHIEREQNNRYDDETISAITGQPREKVYLWRMGLAKPRGCRILEKLEPYEITEGKWTKKR